MKLLKRDIPKRAAVVVVALVAVASVVTGREKPAIELVREAPARQVQQVDDELDISGLQRTAPSTPQNDPFASRSFAPKEPPQQQHAAAPRAPERPTAPPLPFRYMGKLIDGGAQEVFLLRGQETFSVAAGVNVDGQYRVESISDTEIVFTYLPLKTRQSLPL